MKIELPGLQLALKNASSGIGRGNHYTSTAVLLDAAEGRLRASMTDGRRLAVGKYECEGDLLVAVDAERLRKFLTACEAPSVTISQVSKSPDAVVQCGSLEARFVGCELEMMPSHEAPSGGERVVPAELCAMLRGVEAATRDHKMSGEGKVTLCYEQGRASVFGAFGSGFMVYGERQQEEATFGSGADLSGYVIPGTLAADAPASGGVMVANGKAGFIDAGMEVYEPLIDLPVTMTSHAVRFPSIVPGGLWTPFDAKSLANALQAQSVFISPSEDRRVVLKSGNGMMEAKWRSYLGEFLAKLDFEGPEFEIKISPSLIQRALPLLGGTPSLIYKDCQLWFRGGNYTAAVAGFYR